jgi:hypothetical protein
VVAASILAVGTEVTEKADLSVGLLVRAPRLLVNVDPVGSALAHPHYAHHITFALSLTLSRGKPIRL